MKKELGFIGLGRMGLNMTTNLVEKGYKVVGSDPSAEARESADEVGIDVVENYQDMMEALPSPRVVWVMVPSKFVDSVLDEELNFLDCGTSGGMEGARHGASIMVGGKAEVFAPHEHIFKALAAENGYARVGNEGAGHFVKMVHNGIEYGMMGAIAEGVSVLHEHEEEFGIDLKEVFKPYENESIITSKLVTWLRQAYDEGQIEAVAGEVPTGETEFEMEHIISIADTKVLEAALAQRKQTREQESYLGKLVASMRNQFGGHKVIDKK